MRSFSKVASLLVLFIYAHAASGAPTPSPQFTEAGDAYSGTGGTANGGSVINNADPSSNKGLLGGLKLIDAFSHNAGPGGKANSGVALSGPTNSTMSNNLLGSASSSSGTNVIGSAYSGTGGSASGGDIAGDESGGLVDLFTGNAGKGGNAASGGAGNNIVPASPKLQTSVSKGPAQGQPPRLLRIIRRPRFDID